MSNKKFFNLRRFAWVILLPMGVLSVFLATDSASMSLTFAVIAAISLALLIHGQEIFRGRKLRKFLRQFAKDKELEDVESIIRSYVFFHGYMYTAVVKVDHEGIFLWSIGICSCVIPWSAIARMKILRSGQKTSRAQVFIKDEWKDGSPFTIPWRKEFDVLVPQTIGVT